MSRGVAEIIDGWHPNYIADSGDYNLIFWHGAVNATGLDWFDLRDSELSEIRAVVASAIDKAQSSTT